MTGALLEASTQATGNGAVMGALLEVTTQQEWDEQVRAHPRGHMLQSWGWGELKGRFGWQPLRLMARDAEGRTALAQLLIRRQFGLAVCYVPRGPLWSGHEPADTLLLRGLLWLARRRRAAFLRIEPNLVEDASESADLHSLLLVQGFEISSPLQPRTSIHLDLTPEPDQLQAAMSKGHRADIKRASKKEGVEVRVGRTAEDLEAFHQIMVETGRRAGFAIHDRAYYQAAWDLFGGPGDDSDARLLLAEREGQVVAAFLIFGWGAEAQYMYSGANEAGLRSGANHLLQWEALSWAKAHGCAAYDFWGIPDAFGEAALAEDQAERERLEEAAKSHPLFGVYRFKKGFGGQVVRYLPAYDYVFIRPAYWIWQSRRGD